MELHMDASPQMDEFLEIKTTSLPRELCNEKDEPSQGNSNPYQSHAQHRKSVFTRCRHGFAPEGRRHTVTIESLPSRQRTTTVSTRGPAKQSIVAGWQCHAYCPSTTRRQFGGSSGSLSQIHGISPFARLASLEPEAFKVHGPAPIQKSLWIPCCTGGGRQCSYRRRAISVSQSEHQSPRLPYHSANISIATQSPKKPVQRRWLSYLFATAYFGALHSPELRDEAWKKTKLSLCPLRYTQGNLEEDFRLRLLESYPHRTVLTGVALIICFIILWGSIGASLIVVPFYVDPPPGNATTPIPIPSKQLNFRPYLVVFTEAEHVVFHIVLLILCILSLTMMIASYVRVWRPKLDTVGIIIVAVMETTILGWSLFHFMMEARHRTSPAEHIDIRAFYNYKRWITFFLLFLRVAFLSCALVLLPIRTSISIYFVLYLLFNCLLLFVLSNLIVLPYAVATSFGLLPLFIVVSLASFEFIGRYFMELDLRIWTCRYQEKTKHNQSLMRRSRLQASRGTNSDKLTVLELILDNLQKTKQCIEADQPFSASFATVLLDQAIALLAHRNPGALTESAFPVGLDAVREFVLGRGEADDGHTLRMDGVTYPSETESQLLLPAEGSSLQTFEQITGETISTEPSLMDYNPPPITHPVTSTIPGTLFPSGLFPQSAHNAPTTSKRASDDRITLKLWRPRKFPHSLRSSITAGPNERDVKIPVSPVNRRGSTGVTAILHPERGAGTSNEGTGGCEPVSSHGSGNQRKSFYCPPQPVLLSLDTPFQGTNPLPESTPPRIMHHLNEEVMPIIEGVGRTWDVDILLLAQSVSHPIVPVGSVLLHSLIGACNSAAAVETFLIRMNNLYKSNPYHNAAHACMVGHTAMCLSNALNLWESWSPVELATLMIAALGHDVGHRGRSASYYSSTLDPLVIIYNENSPLENLHASLTVRLLQEQDCNIFGVYKQQLMTATFRKRLAEFILVTDMKRHFDMLSLLRVRKVSPDFDIYSCPDDFQLIGKLCMKAADLSHSAVPWQTHTIWSFRVCEEFYQQGDEEKRLQLPVSPLCDRNGHKDFCKSQKGFIDIVVTPLYQELRGLCEVLGGESDQADSDLLDICCSHLSQNAEEWEKRIGTLLPIPDEFSAMPSNQSPLLESFIEAFDFASASRSNRTGPQRRNRLTNKPAHRGTLIRIERAVADIIDKARRSEQL